MAEDSTLRRGYPFTRNHPDMKAPRFEPPASDSDPLAELARLIGQTKPFGETPSPRSNARDREWPAGRLPQAQALPLAADHRDTAYHDHDYRHQPDQSQAYDQQHWDEQQQFEAQQQYDAQTDYGQGQPETPYYGDNGQLAPEDPYAQHDEYDEPAPRRRSGLITVGAVIGLALLGTAGAYGYRTLMSGGAPAVPPLIKAEGGPNKIAPAQQSSEGGAKQIYDRVGSGGQTEKVVSREEQPVDVKPTNARPAYVPAQGGAASPSVGAAASQLSQGWPSPPGATVQQSSAPQSSGPAPQASEPRKVRTVTIRGPDQPTGSPSSAPPPVTQRVAAPVDTPAAGAPAARPAPAPSRASNAPLALTPQGASAERTASAEPRISTTSTSSTSGGGAYVVQLSAQKTQEEASAAFRAAQARYPNLLGNRQLIVRRKEIAGKGTFYGAQVGPFASREGAVQLCEDLKSAGGSCMVQKN